MTYRRQYENPPIEEAICEFRFSPGQEWDPTIPGKLQGKLGDQYSGRPRESRVVQIGFEAGADIPPNVRFGEGLARVQLLSAEGHRMVAVGPDVLSIHMLRPYQDATAPGGGGWNDFRDRIRNALDAYCAVIGQAPVARIGLRYINKVVVPDDRIETAQRYLKCTLPIVPDLPHRVHAFMSRIEYAYENDIRLVLSQGSVDAPLDSIGILLDLDVIWESTTTVQSEEAMVWVEKLRDHERAAFEAVITDQAREQFDAN